MQQRAGILDHHPDCDFWFDFYTFECTCGASRPKHPEFDEYAARCAAYRGLSNKNRSPLPSTSR